MYSDRLQYAPKRSITDRLNANSVSERPVTAKRQRQNDGWKRNLFYDKPQFSRSEASNIGEKDLRLQLQRRVAHRNSDLREKLTGSMHAQAAQPLIPNVPKPKPVLKAINPTNSSAIGKPSVLMLRKVVGTAFKKPKKKAETSVDGLLESLGLEKYQIQLQAEEVDMEALKQMTDEDLKTLGIPMGPRKKILSAIASKT